MSIGRHGAVDIGAARATSATALKCSSPAAHNTLYTLTFLVSCQYLKDPFLINHQKDISENKQQIRLPLRKCESVRSTRIHLLKVKQGEAQIKMCYLFINNDQIYTCDARAELLNVIVFIICRCNQRTMSWVT